MGYKLVIAEKDVLARVGGEPVDVGHERVARLGRA